MSNTAEDGGNLLVRVRAQVMTRDDSAGGWVAMGGGGLSNVSVRKVEIPSISQDEKLPINNNNNKKYEYIIHGKRMSDQTVVLRCTITRDFTYYKVMPTFHHWQTGDMKFGLTFQAAADARVFDQGVRNALEEYLRAMGMNIPKFKPPIPTPDESPGDEEDVFMALELPSKNNSSHSSSQDSAKTDPLSNSSSLHRPGHMLSSTHTHHKPVERSMTEPSSYIPSKALPLLDTGQIDLIGRGGGGGGGDLSISLKNTLGSGMPGVPPSGVGVARVGVSLVSKGGGGDELKKSSTAQTRLCKFCQEQFSETDNPRGSCRFGPDPRGAIFDTLQCLPCAQYVQEKCNSRRSESRRTMWITLSFLFRYVVPLLCCCCGVLKTCHEPCIKCGICGAKHCAQDL